MNGLWSKYFELDYSYYWISIKDSDCIRKYFSKGDCLAFIQEHFEKGKKTQAFDFPFQEEFNKKGKHQHTVALYFLGLHLQGLFDEKLKQKLSRLLPTYGFDSWYDFRYTWFLTCLYHDTASCIEQFSRNTFLPERKKMLDYYLGKLDVQYTPYNHVPLRERGRLVRFSELLVKNYFYYRMDRGVLDHGIIGGYYLFDRLYKNFCEQTKNADLVVGKNLIRDGLSYRIEHLDHFAYIVDAIICHNLWCAYEPNVIETYKEYGLDPLIIGEDSVNNNWGHVQNQKLNVKDYPLQFLLCLLDSIEPVKRFTEKDGCGVSAYEVLNRVSIEKAGSDAIKIERCPCLKRQNSSSFTGWMNSIKELSKWMDVTVIFEGENQVNVNFNI